MKGLKLNNILAIRPDAFKGEHYILFILNSFYFKLYIKKIFSGLVAYKGVKTYCVLACNLVLLAILISMHLINATLYNRYNSKYITAIKD